MDQPESLHFERLQAGHNRKCSDWRLPWAAHQHLGRLTVEELQINRKDWSAVPDGCLQSAQSSAVCQSGWRQQPEYRAYRLQRAELRCWNPGLHHWARVRGRKWSLNDQSGECSCVPEYNAVEGGRYREYAIGPKPGIPVLGAVHILVVAKPSHSQTSRWQSCQRDVCYDR